MLSPEPRVDAFGELLQRHRLEHGLTQEMLAERAGISRRAVQRLEAGLGQPQRETLRRLIESLALPPNLLDQLTAAGLPAPRRRSGSSHQVRRDAERIAASEKVELAPPLTGPTSDQAVPGRLPV